ncbi:MAG: hypothetical protein PHV11_04420 [Candidatus Bipolaricaulis sp.]|nr:hypothetical protein [Candidatus Bipolaricaulis sp.]
MRRPATPCVRGPCASGAGLARAGEDIIAGFGASWNGEGDGHAVQ